MTISKALVTIAGSALAGIVVGGLFGYALGYFAPDLYRALFMRVRDAPIDPVQIGTSLGCINGCFVGLFAGIISVVTTTWYEVRKLGHTREEKPTSVE